ncbi:hypothetical protein [Nocardioides conyzicola]|uniref:Uncharacterized protein n=1 Tax=Nocardioides conyzicola TaxID=1651781 RepID=A0ABP8Y5W8_9ACTN
MSTRTIDQLEHELHGDDHVGPGGPDLSAIRAAGRRRRHRSALVAGGGVLASAVALGLVLSGSFGPGIGAVDPPPAGHPHQLSPVAERALTEIPGAVQVSDWQVVIPAPDAPRPLGSRVGHRDRIVAAVPLGTATYAEVGDYPPSAFPAWLNAGATSGVVVESGDAELACVAERRNFPVCSPAVLSDERGTRYYEGAMAFADFTDPGAGMGVFTFDDYSTGAAGQLVVAGLHGTDVASVELVSTTGETVAGHVEAGTVVAHQTLLWGRVPGTVARVIAYDEAGDVLEDHHVEACDDRPRCEVR